MKLLIAYATSEGQTRKIARHIMDRLVARGHTCELLGLKDATDVELGLFDQVILAASVHAGHYQNALSKFVEARQRELLQVPTLFLSVSLAAAGHDAEDWKGLDRVVQDLTEATGWAPARTEQIAGAYKPSEYNVLERFVMRRIIATKDPETDPNSDHEYTNWAALDALIDDWAG